MNLNKANLVLFALVAGLSLPTWLTIVRDRESFVDTSAVPKLLEGFTVDNVASLVLAQPKKGVTTAPTPGQEAGQKPPVQYDQLTFQRNDEGFVFGQGMGDLMGAPVVQQMLELQVWKHLQEIPMDKETVVLRDATDEQLAEYGLDLEHAFVVKAGNVEGAVLAEVLVGNDSAGSQQGADAVRGVYVRRADSRDVALYEVPFWNRSIAKEQWVDRSVWKTPADTIRRIELENQTGKVVFRRAQGESSWQADAPPAGRAAVRQIEAEGLAQRLAFLQAAELVRPLAGADLRQAGLDQPAVRVSLSFERDGKEVTEQFALGKVQEGKSAQYMSCSSHKFLLTAPQAWASALERDLAEYFDPAPAPAQPSEAPPEASKDEAAPVAPKPEPAAEAQKSGGGDPAPAPQQEPPPEGPKAPGGGG